MVISFLICSLVSAIIGSSWGTIGTIGYNTLDSVNWEPIQMEEYDISEILLALSDMLHYSLDQFTGQVLLSVEMTQAENCLKI